MKPSNNTSGFTLVELAIVLVIIGLIIGGVLAGQDLIRSATIRSVITDVEKINAAATTFRGKYNGLPGDLLNTKAVEFGLNTAAADGNRDGAAGRGDGNAVIEACAAAANGFGCETGLFWRDLSQAALIPGQFNTYTSTLATVAANSLGSVPYVPKTRLRDTALITVFNSSGRNFLAIGASNNAAIAAAGAAGAITYTSNAAGAAVTPLEARNIDEKVDDGAPLTGTMYAISAVAPATNPTVIATAAAAAANICVNSTTPASYTATTDAFLNNVACAVAIRASF